MCSCDNFDDPAFSAYGYRKARKQHQCYECCRPILPGQTYHYYTAKHDEVYTTKTCLWCDAIVAGFNAVKDDPHCTYELGELRNSVRECMREYGFDGKKMEMWGKFRAAFKQARA